MAKKKAERPTTIDVEISTGETITVGMLDWKGYKELKPALVNMMATRAAEAFSKRWEFTKEQVSCIRAHEVNVVISRERAHGRTRFRNFKLFRS